MNIADPWAHRGVNMRCRTCMWFVAKAKSPASAVVADPLTQAVTVPSESARIGTAQTLISTTPALGRCRRHAPTMNGFPAVFELDWCGDHKLDETKI